MVTTYSKADLISAMKFVLSQERTDAIINHPEASSMAPVEERLREVHDADFRNWRVWKGEQPKPKRVPKVGDTVIYIPSKDQEYDKHARHNGATQVPALITAVWGDTPEAAVNLTVFPDLPYEDPKFPESFCPPVISVSSCCALPEGTHNPQTGMWKFK